MSARPSWDEWVSVCTAEVVGACILLLPPPGKAPVGREVRMMLKGVGTVHAGEIPCECFIHPKPSLADLLVEGPEADGCVLSARACKGVLHRDRGRGRRMPEPLLAALLAQSEARSS